MILFLKSGEKFSVDFENIYRFATPFFNNSFSNLAVSFGFEKMQGISLLNISDVGRLCFASSFDNARTLFSVHSDLCNSEPEK